MFFLNILNYLVDKVALMVIRLGLFVAFQYNRENFRDFGDVQLGGRYR